MISEIEKDIEYYRHLLKSSYSDAVKQLKDANGECIGDYYNEKSFKNYINGKNKKPRHGKKVRQGLKGLETHHIDENKVANLSSLEKIKNDKEAQNFDFQRKSRIVYCNLLEHIILHALIAKETNNSFGYEGYESLYRKVNNWVQGIKIPKADIDRKSYERIKLTKKEKVTLLGEIAEYMPLKAE
ncbi:hypothetical protein NSA11_00070 [Lactobacillus taiwanensis]|uniref:hypothetical protein n=1 Tax=Lactobacillus taiwanensis TaxID=508451 RepID=UPI00214B6FAD|nr:hypothetical protein [Lactobacillus taiwanensis]MCR1902348.1 hypothetical protein [Lactobacillus taiwanensis]